MLNEKEKFDLKNKFINRLGKRVFDICYNCISRINCDSEEFKEGFILHFIIVFYNRPDLHITLYIKYACLLTDVFNYYIKRFTIKIISEIYDTLYKELDK